MEYQAQEWNKMRELKGKLRCRTFDFIVSSVNNGPHNIKCVGCMITMNFEIEKSFIFPLFLGDSK